MINKKQVEHIANLARLRLSDKEKEKFLHELSSILDFVEKLNEVDISNVEPFISQNLKNIFRKDKPRIMNHESRIKNLLEQAPEREGGLIKTKPIF